MEAKNSEQAKHDEKCGSVGALSRGAAARLEVGHDSDSGGDGASGAAGANGQSLFEKQTGFPLRRENCKRRKGGKRLGEWTV